MFDAVPTEEVVEAVAQLHALESSVRAVLCQAVAEVERRGEWRLDGARSMVGWLVERLGVGYATASELARVARELETLPACAAVLGEGRMSFDAARALTRFADADADAELAAEAPSRTVASLESQARRHERVRDDQAADALARRFFARRVNRRTGNWRLVGELPAVEGESLWAALDPLADAVPPNPSGISDSYEARCADALVALATGHLASGTDPARATVVVHADAGALDGGRA